MKKLYCINFPELNSDFCGFRDYRNPTCFEKKKEFDKFIDSLDLYKINFWVEVYEI